MYQYVCSKCGGQTGSSGICWPCSTVVQPSIQPSEPQSIDWSGIFKQTTPQPIKLSDEDIDKIAQAVLDKFVKGIGL